MARRATLLLACTLALAAASPPASPRGFDFDAGWISRAAASADLDGDGARDLVLAEAFLDFGLQRGRVVVFLGDPASPGRWRSRTAVPVDANPHDLLLSDLDGNGRLDIATAGTADGTATVLLQSPAGAFARADYAAAAGARGIAAGDLDRDGLPDLAVAGRRDAVVLLQDGNAPGTFLAPATVAPGTFPSCIAVADMDGASGNDLVLGLFDSVEIRLQDASAAGTFPGATSVAAPGRDIERIVAADLDGNGRTDIACAQRGLPFGGPGRGLGLLLQDPAGGLVFASSGLDPFQPLRTLEIQDMDADGTPDLLASGGGRIAWYRQDPAARGTFKRAGRRVVPASEGGTAGGDFDGDGLGDAGYGLIHPGLLLQNPARPNRFRAPRPFLESPL